MGWFRNSIFVYFCVVLRSYSGESLAQVLKGRTRRKKFPKEPAQFFQQSTLYFFLLSVSLF